MSDLSPRKKLNAQIFLSGCEDSFEKSKDKSGSIAACQSGCEFQTSAKPPKPEVAVEEKKPEVDVKLPEVEVKKPEVAEKKPEVAEKKSEVAVEKQLEDDLSDEVQEVSSEERPGFGFFNFEVNTRPSFPLN